jgi:hypothetical protein
VQKESIEAGSLSVSPPIISFRLGSSKSTLPIKISSALAVASTLSCSAYAASESSVENMLTESEYLTPSFAYSNRVCARPMPVLVAPAL